ncbi:MAG: hypothetical protein LBL82_03620 [Oscillospiraceae bacterium]|jgi:uncharacterized membrane protein|nr:hypothetical protein [Oscillospiraceae bacterium]
MSIAFKLILYFSLIIVVPIVFVMLSNESKPKKNIILGVTLPYQARTDEAVLHICARFRRYMRNTAIICIASSLLLFLLPSLSLFLTLLLLWLEIVIILPYLLYARANLALSALKRERGWGTESEGVLMVDTSSVALKTRRIGHIWFAIPTIISLVPAVIDLVRGEYLEALILSGSGVLICGLFWGIHGIIYRQRAEIVEDDSALTAVLTRVRRRNFGLMCCVGSYLSAALVLSMWLFMESNAAFIITTGAYTLGIIALALWTEMRTRFVQQRLTAESGKGTYIDEDSQWIFGLFYYNPNDRHFMKNDRVGLGTTVNLAKTSGKILGGLCALTVVAMPLLGLWMMSEEYSPPTLEVSERLLVATHGGTKYELELDDVVSAELLDELPNMNRVAGTGMETVLKGRFRTADGENCRVCLDPTSAPFIRIETSEGVYYIADRDGAVTREAFDFVNNAVNAE